jgi:hypothetical protein
MFAVIAFSSNNTSNAVVYNPECEVGEYYCQPMLYPDFADPVMKLEKTGKKGK